MKKVTEINKVGPIWRHQAKGTLVEVVDENFIFRWVQGYDQEGTLRGWRESESNFLNNYELIANSMDEEEFKEWCITGKKPNLKTETEIKSTDSDPVHHPSHYTSDPSGIECIEITRHRNFNIGNAIKHLWRAGLKDGNSDIQDLQKAIWYIQDEIKRLKGGE